MSRKQLLKTIHHFTSINQWWLPRQQGDRPLLVWTLWRNVLVNLYNGLNQVTNLHRQIDNKEQKGLKVKGSMQPGEQLINYMKSKSCDLLLFLLFILTFKAFQKPHTGSPAEVNILFTLHRWSRLTRVFERTLRVWNKWYKNHLTCHVTIVWKGDAFIRQL